MIDAASYGPRAVSARGGKRLRRRVLEELQLVRRALRENPGYVTLMDTPAVAGPGKARPAAAGLFRRVAGAAQFPVPAVRPARALAAARLPDRL